MPGPVSAFLNWLDRIADRHCPSCGSLLSGREIVSICFGAAWRRMDILFGGDGSACRKCGAKLALTRASLLAFWPLALVVMAGASEVMGSVSQMIGPSQSPLWLLLAAFVPILVMLIALNLAFSLIFRWTVRLELLP